MTARSGFGDTSAAVAGARCRCCPSLPYLRFGIVVVAMFLAARILLVLTLTAAAEAAKLAICPISEGSSGCTASGNKRRGYVALWRRSLLHRRRPILPPELFRCWSRSAGSQPIGFCLPASACTCSAGRRFSLRTVSSPRCRPRHRPPELEHTAFAWRRRTPRPYALAVEVIRMDAKAEKIALFRYGLIAPLVLEPLPR